MSDRTLNQWALDLQAAEGQGGLIEVVRKALVPVGYKAARDAKKNATTAPKVRTGALRNSINSRVFVDGSNVRLELGASMVYAPIQEYGGTILYQARKGATVLRGNRYLGKAMDLAVDNAKTSLTAAVTAYLATGKSSG
jgi:hypothetical protein